MGGRITEFIREFVLVFSIITVIVGFIFLLLGVLWYSFNDIVRGNASLTFISDLGEWNAYLLVVGLIIFLIGLYYLYSFLKNKKFVLEELRTNKRSELLKKHKELKSIVKRLPKKYQKMLNEKEEELRI